MTVPALSCPCNQIASLRKGGNGEGGGALTTAHQPSSSSLRAARHHHGAASSSAAAVFCETCVARRLHHLRIRREESLQEHQRAKDECASQLAGLKRQSTQVAELSEETLELRHRLSQLRQECSALAMTVASKVVETEERKARVFEFAGGGGRGGQQHQQDLSVVVNPTRQDLHQFQSTLFDDAEGAMSTAYRCNMRQIHLMRCQWALQAMKMYRLDIGDALQHQQQEDKKRSHNMQDPNNKSQGSKITTKLASRSIGKHARGIGKVSGLPLPHAGPELYSVMPPEELQSALRLVAGCTRLVAQCLGIPLPHPILFRYNEPRMNDIMLQSAMMGAEGAAARNKDSSNNGPTPSSHHPGASTTSLFSLVGGTAAIKSAFSRASILSEHTLKTMGSSSSSQQKQPFGLSMEPSAVAERIHAATSVIFMEQESHNSKGISTSTSHYVLSALSQQDSSSNAKLSEERTIALQLLQNNVVALCIRAGVPVDSLWPAQALLMNLYELERHCQEEVVGMNCERHPERGDGKETTDVQMN